MVKVLAIVIIVITNYLIFLSLAKAAGRADRELREIHKACFLREEEIRGGNFKSSK